MYAFTRYTSSAWCVGWICASSLLLRPVLSPESNKDTVATLNSVTTVILRLFVHPWFQISIAKSSGDDVVSEIPWPTGYKTLLQKVVTIRIYIMWVMLTKSYWETYWHRIRKQVRKYLSTSIIRSNSQLFWIY